MPFLRVSDYLKTPRDPMPWIVEGLLPKEGSMLISGRPKTGKSFAALSLAIAVSSGGVSWLGFPVQIHGPVLYLQVDMGAVLWRNYLERIALAGYDLSNLHTLDISDKSSPFPFNIFDPTHYKFLKEEVTRLKPVLVILDTLAKIHTADENDASAMRNVMNRVFEATFPAASLLVAHNRKLPAQAGLAVDIVEDVRGSSSVVGTVDSIISVSGQKASKRFVKFTGRGAEIEDKPLECFQDPDSGFLMFKRHDDEEKEKLLDSLRSQFPDADRSIIVRKLMDHGIPRSTAYKLYKKA